MKKLSLFLAALFLLSSLIFVACANENNDVYCYYCGYDCDNDCTVANDNENENENEDPVDNDGRTHRRLHAHLFR